MLIYYLYLVGIMSFITIIIYAIDKIKAVRGSWRISEVTLLLFSFFFGALGGLFSMYIIRHKNRKIKFIILNWLFFIIHSTIAIYLLTNNI